MYEKSALITLFRERALKFGNFTLASGKQATYYLDGKQITLNSRGLKLVSEGLWDLLSEFQFDAIGGMSIGADPIVAGLLTEAASRGREMDGFLVRKESKGHGTNKFIEGPLRPGQRVAVVEDVVTTGGSSIMAADRIRDFGAEVVVVAAIIDRQEGGTANFSARGLPLRSLLTIADFGLKPVVD